MSIQDRDWYSREVLRKLGIRKDGEADPDPSAGPFGINNRYRKQKIRERRRAWVRLVLVVLVVAGTAGGLFVYLVKTISSR